MTTGDPVGMGEGSEGGEAGHTEPARRSKAWRETPETAMVGPEESRAIFERLQGRRRLANRLRQGLGNVPERNERTEKPAPTWTAQVSTG